MYHVCTYGTTAVHGITSEELVLCGLVHLWCFGRSGDGREMTTMDF